MQGKLQQAAMSALFFSGRGTAEIGVRIPRTLSGPDVSGEICRLVDDGHKLRPTCNPGVGCIIHSVIAYVDCGHLQVVCRGHAR